MKKREIKVVIIFLVFIVGILLLFLSNHKKNQYIKLPNIKIENKDKLLLSDSDKNNCINGLIEYLNSEYYYVCNKIVFYNNEVDKTKNKKYFYALVVGGDNSLIEITNLGNGNFKYSYVGNEVTENRKSKVTGVTYKQIVDYEQYKKEKELEKIREEGSKALPDDTEMP